MKIKVLRNLGRGLPPYKEGQVVTASEKEASMLISRGLAEALPTTLKAVSSAPAIAKAEPPKVAAKTSTAADSKKTKADSQPSTPTKDSET